MIILPILNLFIGNHYIFYIFSLSLIFAFIFSLIRRFSL